MVMTIRNTCRMFDNLFQLVRNREMKHLNITQSCTNTSKFAHTKSDTFNPWNLGGSFMVQKKAITSPIPVF